MCASPDNKSAHYDETQHIDVHIESCNRDEAHDKHENEICSCCANIPGANICVGSSDTEHAARISWHEGPTCRHDDDGDDDGREIYERS